MMLKKLLSDFQAQELETHKAETNAINAHALEGSASDDLTSAAEKSRDAKQEAFDDAKQSLKDAEDLQKNTQDDLTADESTLSSTEQSCDQKAAEWAERSKVRSQEREAIHTAIGILAKVTGVRTEPPENPVLPQSPVDQTVSFLQMPHNVEFEQALELLRQD